MRDRTRLGIQALGIAVLLGLAGDLLLRSFPWGANAPVFIGILVLGAGLLVPRAGLPLLGEARWLMGVALLFALGLAWRDSSVLVVVDVLAVLLALGLAAHRALPGWPRVGGLLDYLAAFFISGFHALGGVLALVFADVDWKEVPRTGWTRVMLSILRGLIIAIPLLLLFGTLFMAADAVFSGLVSDLFAIDVKEAVAHLFWIGVWTWITAGFLRQLLFCTVGTGGLIGIGARLDAGKPTASEVATEHSEDQPDSSTDVGEGVPSLAPVFSSVKPPVKRPNGRVALLGIVELSIVLGLLDLLFLAFVLVQFRYLFGGAELVRVTSSLTYAEYARRGFFELVAVAALLLPIMLTIDWLARLDRPHQARLYLVLAGALIGLLFVVIASALFRMSLYTQEYGLTELRLYTTTFMAWITLVAIWYLGTVLRERRELFVFGAMVAGLAVAVVLNAINPDDAIVRTNASRADAPSRFDGAYATLLSADSVPVAIEALSQMPVRERYNVANSLLRRWRPPDAIDWRTWNYGRWRAWQAVGANEAMLREVAGWPPSGEPPANHPRSDWPDVPPQPG